VEEMNAKRVPIRLLAIQGQQWSVSNPEESKVLAKDKTFPGKASPFRAYVTCRKISIHVIIFHYQETDKMTKLANEEILQKLLMCIQG
jgi:hypothetical protein